MVGVVAGVTFHAFGEGAARPVGFLGSFFEFDAKKVLDQMAQAKLPQAEQSRGEHCVENRAGDEFVMLAQEAQIVIRAVHDEGVGGEGIEQGIEVDSGEGVNQVVTSHSADLDEADLFRVGMQAVGLRIHGDPSGGADAGKEGGEFLIGINHAESIGVSGARCQVSSVNVRWRERDTSPFVNLPLSGPRV